MTAPHASRPERSQDRGSDRSVRHVVMLCPGGLEHAGGIGRAMAYLIGQWKTEPYAPEVTVLDTRGGSHLAFAPWYFLLALTRLAWRGLSGRADVVHVNIASRGSTARKFCAVLVCVALRLRFVLHLHGAQFHLFHAGLPPLGQRLVRWMFRRADRVIVLGQGWRRFAMDALDVPAGAIDVICNGVPAPVSPPARTRAKTPHIVFLGRLGDRKGVPELLAALASGSVAGLDWHATLAGDGEIERFRDEAARLGIGAKLAFPGWIGQGEAAALLASADLFVLPSHNEGLPVAVLEALAHGLPVLATPVGALPEFLTDGVSAVFVPPADAASLARSLERLLTGPELRATLGLGGHAVFRRHFAIGTTARAMRDCYRHARERGPRAPEPAPPGRPPHATPTTR